MFGILTLSSRLGTFLGTLLIGGLLTAGMPWTMSFFVGPLFTFACAIMTLVLVRNRPPKQDQHLEQTCETTSIQEEIHPLSEYSTMAALLYFATSLRVVLISVTQVCATMIMEFGALFTLY